MEKHEMIATVKRSTSTIDQVRALLNDGRSQEALDLIHHLGQSTPEIENARGVCLLRLGRVDEALSVLRNLAFQGHICIPSDTPVVFRTNFATALLMAGHTNGAIAAIDHLSDKQHPAVGRIHTAIRRWKAGLSWPERFFSYIGRPAGKAVVVDWAAGDLS